MSRYVVIPLLILALIAGTLLYGEGTVPVVLTVFALVSIGAGVKLWQNAKR